MHEIGMLRQTAELATRFAEENGIDAVKNITIEIGELSGALPEVFMEYFSFIAEQYPRVRGAELTLRTVPGEGLCLDCHCLYDIMQREGVCPRCGSREKKVLGGTDVQVLSIGY